MDELYFLKYLEPHGDEYTEFSVAVRANSPEEALGFVLEKFPDSRTRCWEFLEKKEGYGVIGYFE